MTPGLIKLDARLVEAATRELMMRYNGTGLQQMDEEARKKMTVAMHHALTVFLREWL